MTDGSGPRGPREGPLVGLVLAAGAGSRFGGPKALARRDDGTPWVALAVRLLEASDCDRVVVVLGAEAEEARRLVPASAEVVVARDWAKGMGASLAAGLRALPQADAALITLVDLPDLPQTVLDRVLGGGAERDRLARAVYAGEPGHPVLVGRDHWEALVDSLHGDPSRTSAGAEGGRTYLEEHGVDHVECGDLFDGEDVDRPLPPV